VTESGFLLLPQTLASFVLGTSAGPLARRFGSKRLLLVGCLLSGVGYAAMAVWHGSVGVIASVAILMGTGSGLVFAAMANVIVSSVRPDQTGVASGMNANIRTIGGSLGSAIVSSLVTAHAGPDGLPLERGYVVGFLLMSGAVLLAALAAAFVPAVGRVPASGREPRAELTHAELAMLPGGTVVGDEPE
jgi:MFS family permease